MSLTTQTFIKSGALKPIMGGVVLTVILAALCSLTGCSGNSDKPNSTKSNPLLSVNKKLAADFIIHASTYAERITNLHSDTMGEVWSVCVQNPYNYDDPFAKAPKTVEDTPCWGLFKQMQRYAQQHPTQYQGKFANITLGDLYDQAALKRLGAMTDGI